MAFTIKNEIEAEGVSSAKSIEILTVLGCICGPHFVILAWTSDKLWWGQTQNRTNYDLLS